MRVPVALLLAAAGVAAASPAGAAEGAVAADVAEAFVGHWWTEGDKSRVRIERCADDASTLCGRIVELGEPLGEDGRPRLDAENPDPALRDRPIEGLSILRIPARPDDEGVLRDGRIYDPESGRTYRCLLWRDGELLRVKGYLGITLLGRKTTWRPAGDGS